MVQKLFLIWEFFFFFFLMFLKQPNLFGFHSTLMQGWFEIISLSGSFTFSDYCLHVKHLHHFFVKLITIELISIVGLMLDFFFFFHLSDWLWWFREIESSRNLIGRVCCQIFSCCKYIHLILQMQKESQHDQ